MQKVAEGRTRKAAADARRRRLRAHQRGDGIARRQQQRERMVLRRVSAARPRRCRWRRRRAAAPGRTSATSCSRLRQERTMGHRGHSEFRGRPYGPDPFGREAQDRTRIAQVAAKLIAEHGITDWSLAKRKAARQLMLPERTALPGDDEIEAALADYHALFGGDAHVAQLARAARARRCAGCSGCAQFEPRWSAAWPQAGPPRTATSNWTSSPTTAKAVELALLNAGVAYRTMHADRRWSATNSTSTRRQAACACRCARPRRRGSGPAATGMAPRSWRRDSRCATLADAARRRAATSLRL